MAALNKCIFRKKSGWLSSAGPEIEALVSHCSANFQPILDCLKPNFKLKYEDSENIKLDRVNLHQIKNCTEHLFTFQLDCTYISMVYRCQ